MGGGEAAEADTGIRRRGCSCTKNDFLPEESFQSWGNYMKALSETPMRFKDRLLTRSMDSTELHEIKARSEHDMKKDLTWWDLIWFGIGVVIGSGIFVLTGLEARDHAGPAILLSYVISGVSAMLSVFCYTEFAVEIPVAGGSFAYLRVELGDFVAFIAAGNIRNILLSLILTLHFPVAFEYVGLSWGHKYIARSWCLNRYRPTAFLSELLVQARTPVNATIVMITATAIVAFFTKMDILANLLSISTLFIFTLVAVALLVRRYYVTGVTAPVNRVKLVVCILLILASSIATAIIWAENGDGWIGYVITIPIWFLATLGLKIFVPQAKDPKLWGVPFVPWLPSASILINIFLLGSIDGLSFARFGVWTGVLLIYYLLFGLHASYDIAKESGENRVADGWKKMEEGVVVSSQSAVGDVKGFTNDSINPSQ
ncbi:cationic amino acid transporter 1-like [Jatropha curcas]|uniref:cationic amino acid transporter 1-like n=1 Tax=Jatropha curcas TaxID=180498 RepID=UPI00189306A6|nr:cationic amino acid transporter 1-like [Jatropha curcas]